MNREFVMLGVDRPDRWEQRVNLSDYYCSEKLDGVRAIWIPWTKGQLFQDVPFANKFKDDRNYVCSGLWSRKMKPILCPDWFTEKLPSQIIVDGELFVGRGEFQQAVSIVRKMVPLDHEWGRIKYCLFDIPEVKAVFDVGKIRCDIKQYVTMLPTMSPLVGVDYRFGSFESVVRQLDVVVKEIGCSHVEAVEQVLLPLSQSVAIDTLKIALAAVFAEGGEGLMLRHRNRLWHPKRDDTLIKMVDKLESTAVVSGWNMGEGRLTGKMGSLSVKWGEKQFDIGTGLTDAERLMEGDKPMFFKLGQVVKFNYRELTDDGVPKQPRYKRPD